MKLTSKGADLIKDTFKIQKAVKNASVSFSKVGGEIGDGIADYQKLSYKASNLADNVSDAKIIGASLNGALDDAGEIGKLADDVADLKVGKNLESGKSTELTIYDPEFAARQLLSDGTTSEDVLRTIIPKDVPNTFVPSDTIKDGYKYNFSINGKNMEIKWHSADLNAAIKYPGCNSGSGWTAQIKVGNKLMTQAWRFIKKAKNYTHIPLRGGGLND